jgi:ribonuclease P protein component
VAVPSFAPVAPRAVIAWPSDSQGRGERLDFGPERRLHTPADFGVVFSQRRVLRADRFSLHYRPNDGTTARLGLVVAKKLARRAVLRNAIKRISRDVFRRLRPGLPMMDLVLRLTKPLAALDTATRSALRTEIEALLARVPKA